MFTNWKSLEKILLQVQILQVGIITNTDPTQFTVKGIPPEFGKSTAPERLHRIQYIGGGYLIVILPSGPTGLTILCVRK